jgi:hypothetical protein
MLRNFETRSNEGCGMSPRLDLAVRALERDRDRCEQDLCALRLRALAFKVAVGGPRPIAVVYAVDEEGVEHWLAARSATRGVEAAYVELLSDLLLRGLQAERPPIVDAGGYPRFARRLEHALGPVVHVGSARECGGAGLAW